MNLYPCILILMLLSLVSCSTATRKEAFEREAFLYCDEDSCCTRRQLERWQKCPDETCQKNVFDEIHQKRLRLMQKRI